jgi:hypothetical protein
MQRWNPCEKVLGVNDVPSDQLNESVITAQKEFIDPEVSDLWRQAADAIHERSQDALRRLEEACRGYNVM